MSRRVVEKTEGKAVRKVSPRRTQVFRDYIKLSAEFQYRWIWSPRSVGERRTPRPGTQRHVRRE
ncbi:predicted protein [Sclerotinia sclerotiorum 1980 UF-70]|uniref:Uncharacterized protein n=1 Tax=Sclerotinia sclerotiorum (strain ATCC 18683 / 1980 / Ss-1) TaxID=665079 RepID=A7F8D6_SCLS1|nr:predicted protein [Sclerotinia sclerotiorum 1980 UF-70]EDN99007.1 predicted protein [Sclerotinia sclerotiorum 1980 UF-70]